MELVLCAGFILIVRRDDYGVDYYFLVVCVVPPKITKIPQDRQNKNAQNLAEDPAVLTGL